MRDKGEVCFNAVIFLGSIYLFYVAGSFPRFQTADQLGPSVWPQWLLAATTVLTGVLLIRNIQEMLKQKKPTDIQPSATAPAPRTLLWVMSISIGYAFIVEYIGFVLSIIIYQVLLLYILRVRSIRTLILFPLCQTAVFYLVFMQLLKIPFPRGEGIFLYFSRLFY
jgi:putative tricarboxylic transport membrane protein